YAEAAQLNQPPYADRAIVLRATGTLIGLCGFAPCLAPFHQVPGLAASASDGYSAEVGLYWAVSPEHQRRGYASEAAAALVDYAFARLNVHRLVATTSYDNAPSIGVMRR